MRILIYVVFLGLACGGCAKKAAEITGSYVSPLTYETLSCQQIAEEVQRITARVSIASGVQDKKATDDAVVTAVGIIVFWPALFALKGDDQHSAELARLKGEAEALEQQAIRKNCRIEFRRAAPQPRSPQPTASGIAAHSG